MKKIIISLSTLFVLLFPALSYAQPVSNAEVTRSLDMAKNMIKATTGLSDDFKNFKGDFVTKDKSDNSYFAAKDIDLGTESQYIVVKPSGTVLLAATYSPKNQNDKTPVMAFTAFTGGISTIAGGSDFSIEQDKSSSDTRSLRFFLMFKTLKVASFTFNTESKEGTLIVSVQ